MDTPRLKAPPGACDCHMHVYETRFQPAPTAPFPPPHAPAAAYREVQRALGLERVVVVQPTAYAFDNTCTLEAMAALGGGARGIAIVPPAVSEAELARLTRAGMRGVRYFMLTGGVLPWDSLAAMAAKVASFGWHVDLQFDGREFAARADLIARLPVPVVIDHNGKFLEPVAVDHPAFKALLALLDTGRVWVKLSAPYETSRVGPPGYDDVSALARALVRANPERCLWATNWPHPNQERVPSSAAMLDLLLDWADDDATRQRILCHNPAQFYGFDRPQ